MTTGFRLEVPPELLERMQKALGAGERLDYYASAPGHVAIIGVTLVRVSGRARKLSLACITQRQVDEGWARIAEHIEKRIILGDLP